MRLFFGALVLNFMIFFEEIEASGLSTIYTKPSRNEREVIDHLATSRLHTQSSSKHNNPYLLAHQALDLGGYYSHSPESFYQESHSSHSNFQESSDQQHSTELSNLVKKYNFVDGLPPNVNSPPSMSQNNKIQHPTPEYRQKYLEQENIAWLVDHHRRGRLPASTPIIKTYTDSNGQLQKDLTREETREIRAQLKHLTNSHALRRPNTSLEKPPSALHEIDESITPGGSQKRKKVTEKAAKKKKVSDSHDQFSQQPPLQENPYPDFGQHLIYDPSEAFDPYLENQVQNPHLYYHTNDPNYKPDYNPNPHNNWDYHGGSGFGLP